MWLGIKQKGRECQMNCVSYFLYIFPTPFKYTYEILFFTKKATSSEALSENSLSLKGKFNTDISIH